MAEICLFRASTLGKVAFFYSYSGAYKYLLRKGYAPSGLIDRYYVSENEAELYTGRVKAVSYV